MSVRLMAQVFEAQVQPTAKKFLLIALADYGADDGSSIFPSVDRIAAKVSLSRRQVFRMLRQLQNEGWLTQTEPATSRFPARYQLNISAMTSTSSPVSPMSPEIGLGVTGSHPRGVLDVTPGVTPMSPNPSGDPSGDPSEKRESGRRKRRPARPFPDDFTLNDERRKFAEAGGLKNVGLIFGNFKDWALAGDVWKQDWEATWRRWCRVEREKAEGKKPWRR
jgi:hypothetical protein